MSVSRVSGRSPDQEAVNAIAARQHGVITRSQLARAGFSAGMIARRLRTKQLRALHRAVYLMGPLMAAHARAMAAILACRGRAVLSHWSAAFLWGLLGLREPAWVDVSITGADHRLAGVRVHRTSAIPANEVTRRERIPVTTVARTLLDLAGVAQGRELERALEEALAKRLTSRAALNAMLERHARGRGSARLRALLEGMEPAFTRSEGERQFLALVRKVRLPKPDTNVAVSGHEVDFFWRRERFVAEFDGFAFHSGRKKFERDRQRDAELAAAGVRVVRVTWQQLQQEPEAVAVRLALALSR